ncbi:MAG: EFR1 family ferrodoxin [Acidaminococcus sp.]|jgi:ferredoxin|nr:EFR1 family ferrodoxin [Acidaminococcus sp.]MCI2100277.1 EFR1 family ferrodoxin [Acidaminococcus sp.]MCI2114597.1 EFR1 family ferrodoxin [Acidaminococcus sp.]MCI2116574.1 EFR1 family ferrodoxin [Acidaminococcus sp.]
MKILFFTATGNSLAVAKALGGTRLSIPQLITKGIYEIEDEEAIGIIYPIYAGNTPKIVREYLKRAKLTAPYLFAIGTYGNYACQAMTNFKRYAEKCGYHFQYTNTILMVDNYLDLFEINRQIEKIPSKKTDEQLKKIKKDIAARVMYTPGKSLLTEVINLVVKPQVAKFDSGKLAQSYIVTDACVRCGICAKVCPRGNISVKDHVTFSDHCESCYACLHACPKGALHLKHERSAKRWRHPDVTLAEIIEANNVQ